MQIFVIFAKLNLLLYVLMNTFSLMTQTLLDVIALYCVLYPF